MGSKLLQIQVSTEQESDIRKLFRDKFDCLPVFLFLPRNFFSSARTLTNINNLRLLYLFEKITKILDITIY